MPDNGVVTVSRLIEAPADAIFAVLADPGRHTEFDGSEMVRSVAVGGPISSIGDVFEMNMYFDRLGGDYVMRNHVVEFEPDRRIAWAPAPGDERAAGDRFAYDVPIGHRWIFELTPEGPAATLVTEIYDCTRAPEDFQRSMNYGEVWRDSMTETLAKLDTVCTRSSRP